MNARVSTPIIDERRSARRYPLTLPIELTTASGVTRDISASGVLFEMPGGNGLETGGDVRFSLPLRTMAGQLRCRGRIVRVERAGPHYVVASTIEQWDLSCHRGTAIVKVTAGTEG